MRLNLTGRTLLFAAFFALLFSCTKKQTPTDGTFLLEGSISDCKEPYLILAEIGKQGFSKSDTLALDAKGKFSGLVQMQEETLYSLSYGTDYVTLCPQQGETVKITASGSDFSGTYTVAGSSESELLKQLNARNLKTRSTLKAMSDYLKMSDIENLDSVRYSFAARLQNMYLEEQVFSENFIHKHPGSLTCLIALYRTFEGRPLFDYRGSLEVYKEVLAGLEKSKPNNQHTLILKNFIQEKQQEQDARTSDNGTK